ncbi:J domain-containing protein, partial [Blautia obeum]|nr:J domain-containing protein [Blautia obeum]
MELQYHPDADADADAEDEDDDETFVDDTPPVPRRWFEILGVTQQATIGEIKTAYRTLIQQYHPDRVVHLGEKLRRV